MTVDATAIISELVNASISDLFLKKLEDKETDGEEPPAYAICFFDCNKLKPINDKYGHDKGDLYLKTACATICQVFAHSPVFRIGGDEFAAILQHREYENREELLTLFDQRCADLRAFSTDPWEKISVARGMAEYDPQQDKTVADVVRRADRLMYEDKRTREGYQAR